ncbi:MAG: YedE-related selenium metabolism membrane protein [Synergistaceae bacterium]|jgi:YedE family putative selenium metabolism protein|nr:YedE-related selenium metabolism membrane protein [Synergistaceae bacterium]
MDKILTSRQGPLVAGGVLGALAALLVWWGNPANMGFCAACFTRDIAGALGLHRAGIVQYLRPEIPAAILGAFASALFFREYAPRGGSSPLVRFFLGVCAMFGALVFLGCPWRAYLRVAGGDWNALYGIGGLAVGALIGIAFLWNGFSLGAAERNPKATGLVMPVIAVILLALVVLKPLFGPVGSDGAATGPIFFSKEGPGAAHAPFLISLAGGLIIGWLAQRSRFCTVGALRDLFMLRDGYLFRGIVSFTVAAFVVNYALGQFHPGFEKQPIAHTQELWNFLGMVLSGLAFTLAGGCPGRQLIMAGEGDADAGVFVLGLLTGAAFAHNFSAASSGAGVGPWGIPVTIASLVVCLLIGFSCTRKQA